MKWLLDRFGIHAELSRSWKILLAAIPFVILIGAYAIGSHTRLAENPNDKLMPGLSQMIEAIDRVAFTEDPRTGHYPLIQDTISSLRRILLGISLAAIAGLFVGLNLGFFPGLTALLQPFITFVSIVPPLAILPILFIILGIDELAKVTLIFIGTFPFIASDIYLTVQKIPREQIIKALTLGASQFAIAYRIVLPQIVPKLLDSVALQLGPAWLFLITAEAIASTDGLGYRIFLVRRYLAMDVIIPYVLWITFLGFAMVFALKYVRAKKYPWYAAQQ